MKEMKRKYLEKDNNLQNLNRHGPRLKIENYR